jgi:hypothetical protein
MSSNAWQWVTDARFPSFCLVFARAKSVESVLRAYGADAQSAVNMSLRESIAAFPKRETAVLLRVGTLGEWTFCYEDRELLGITKGVRHMLSRGSETIGLYKGGDGTRSFEHMENCRSLELFEPSHPSEAYGEGPFIFADLVRDKLSTAGSGTTGLSAITQVLADRIGLQLDRDTLEGPLLTAPHREH